MALEIADPFSRDGWEAFVAPAPQGKGQRGQKTEVDLSWDYEKAGLIRAGVHTDKHVIATAADGTQIPVDVVPIPHDGGSRTLFAINPNVPGNLERSRQIFKRADRFI